MSKFRVFCGGVETVCLNCNWIILGFQTGQAEKVLEYFGGKTGGVFIKAGAWDGEYLSNTLFLEVLRI